MRVSTREKIANALQRILRTKAFADVSVGDICGEIDISRTTFYRYFQDKYECMNWVYQNQIRLILEKNRKIDDWKATVYDTVCALYERKEFFSKVSVYKEQNSLMDCIFETGYDYLEGMLKQELQTDELPVDLHWASCMYAKGSIYLLENWLRDGCKESTEFIAQILCDNVPLKIAKYFR